MATTVPASYNLPPVGQVKVWTSILAKPVYPPKGLSLAGQTVLVTGANQGIGYGCAEWLVELGASRIILAVRTISKGEAAAEELRKKSSKVTIDVWQLDMLSYKSVQELAERCQGLDRLDAAILNAGATSFHPEKGPEGHDKVLQVNYLSTVFLSMLLLPVLKAKSPPGKPGRLTLANSGTSLMAKFPQRHADSILEAMDDEKQYSNVDNYTVTKLLCHFWLLKLAEVVNSTDVVVNLVDPGLVKGTQLLSSLPTPVGFIVAGVKSVIARTIRDGSSCYIDACFVKGEESHGSFVMDWRIYTYPQHVHGEAGKAIADKVWQETMQELAFSGVQDILKNL